MLQRPPTYTLGFFSLTLFGLLLLACGKQGAGERCSVDSNSDDCQEGLVCTSGSLLGRSSADLCCPPAGTPTIVNACIPGIGLLPDGGLNTSDGGPAGSNNGAAGASGGTGGVAGTNSTATGGTGGSAGISGAGGAAGTTAKGGSAGISGAGNAAGATAKGGAAGSAGAAGKI